jgi:hypothetical protein
MIQKTRQIQERLVSAFRKSPLIWKLLIFLGIGCHLAFVLNLVWGFFKPLSHDMVLFSPHQGIDFKAVYASGIYARRGMNLYQEGAVDGVEHTVFRYSPIVAFLVGIPFSLISNVRTAYWIWILFNEILFAVNLFLTIYFCKKEERILPCLAAWMLFFPYAVELYMGQFSFLTGSLLFWSALSLWKKRENPALAFWVPAILLKIFPLVLIPVFWKRTSPVKIFFALVLVLVLNLPYFLSHPDVTSYFLEKNYPLGRVPLSQPYFGNQGLYHFALAFRQNLPEIPASFVLKFIRCFGGGVTCLFLYLCLKGRRDPVLLFQLGISLFFILSLEVWEHHYVLILPFFVLHFMQQKRSEHLATAAWILCALPTLYFLINPSGSLKPGSTSLSLNSSETFLYFAIKPMGISIFMAVLFRDLFKQGSVSPDEP